MKREGKEFAQSVDNVYDNVDALKSLFPEAFKDGQLDLSVLGELTGLMDEQGEEKFELNWPGKRAARRVALTPSLGTLRPSPDDSEQWDTTQNLFIEGDNLEVLKLLQKGYANRIKMIYIDPPYNTGGEFIYPDKFKDNLDTYLRYTQQVDDEGMATSSNTESSGRYHTNWLNMMYPRLKLARQLLGDDGVIFISIDDHELEHLRVVCNEIFGEENFLGCFVWKRRSGAMDAVSNVSEDHEYVVCYSKMGAVLSGIARTFEKYSNPDSDPRGDWISDNLSAGKPGGDTHYAITDPATGNEFWPPKGRYWPYNRQTMQKKVDEGRVIFPASSTGTPMLKRFRNEAVKATIPVSTWIEASSAKKRGQGSLATPMNSSATKSLKELFGTKVFSFPKPVELIQNFIGQTASENDIVLDFFAGSGTTAESVFSHNIHMGASARFILVQLPEAVAKDEVAYAEGYRSIPELARERIRRAGNRLSADNMNMTFDTGFRVFRLDTSNIQVWNPGGDDMEQSLLSHEGHFVAGRSEEDILYELLLKRGVDLSSPIDKKEVAGKIVYSVGYGTLFACLGASITGDEIESVAKGIIDWREELATAAETQVVFRDSAFADDVAKTNMTAILEQNGIVHVRSL